MRRGILIIALLALCLSSAALAMDKKSTVQRPTIERTPVAMYEPDSRLMLVNESFEGDFLPAGWTIMTSGAASTWEQSSASANTGENCAAVFYGPPGAFQDEWLVTPALNTMGLGSLLMSFAETQAYWDNYGLRHHVMVSTTVPDDPAAFTSILTMTPADHAIGADWGAVDLSLNDYLGYETVYVALRYEGDWADDWLVDDVIIFEPPDHDVIGVAVAPNGLILTAGTNVEPVFTVKNFGANMETFDVEMIVSTGGMDFYTEVMTVTDLPSGEVVDVTFPGFIIEVGDYTLTGTAMLVGDEDPGNDTAMAYLQCYSQPRTPFGILYTNWGCSPCVPANQALDEWYPLQGNAASLIRSHVDWPSPDDPMYLDNVPECEFLLGMCPTNVNGVPTLYMDNTYDMWDYFGEDWMETVELGYQMSSDTASPLTMQIFYNLDTYQADVAVDLVDALDPDSEYVLFLAVTEDNVEAAGPNGELTHDEAFRKLYPGMEGTPISTEPGMNVYSIPLVPDEAWHFQELRGTAWIQEVPGGKVLNSATMFLRDWVVSVEGEIEESNTPSYATQLQGAYPNPFNPKTHVYFTLSRTQHVKLSVFDITGKRVAELADGVFNAGRFPVSWNGTDTTGRPVASGTYFVHMRTEEGIQTSKMMLVR